MSYQTLTTNLGLAKIAAAIGSGQTISLPTIKLGDGNGNPVTPSPTQIDLVRVVYSGATNSLTVSQSTPNRVTAELVVPASVGGFTVREAGIYDAAGALIFVCNFPNVYKPLPSEGAARDLVVRIVFEVVNSGVINLVIDTNVVVATRAWVTSNFTIAALLPGGTTYQILRKKSNANGDTEWVDPASGQNVIVNVIEENQILAASQTVVNLVTANTNSTAVYIEGVRLRNNQFSINTATRFTLAQSYPAGSRVTILQNEPNGAITQATTGAPGIVELATDAETQAGTDATRAVTPAGLASRTATDARAGIVELATDAETQAGTDATRAVTPAGLASRTATDARAGIVELATDAETQAGTDATRAVTPAGFISAFQKSFTSIGHQKLPGGLIINWGSAGLADQASQIITYSTAFPTAILSVSAVAVTQNQDNWATVLIDYSGTNSRTRIQLQREGNGVAGGSNNCFFIAIGY